MRPFLRPLVCALALGTTTPAYAADVSSSFSPGSSGKGDTPFYSVSYTGATGESNDLTITRDGDFEVLRDTGAPLTAGGGDCMQVDPHTARCSRAHATAGGPISGAFSAHAGDGNDRVDASAAELIVIVTGDAGDDVLTGTALDGGDGDDTLTGTPGVDVLTAGAGRDKVTAGPGDDVVFAGETLGHESSDDIDGGPGRDRITESGVIDLTGAQPSGSPAAPDKLTGFEDAIGGEGDDVLIGDPGDNRLAGGGGADRLTGGDGNDVLEGDAGADDVDGGPGDDLLIAGPGNGREDGTYDTFRCGDGTDAVKYTFRDDFLFPDCEGVDNTRYPEDGLAATLAPIPAKASAGRTLALTWHVPCQTRCRPSGTISVKIAGRRKVVAKARVRRARTGNVPLTIRLTRAQLKLLHRATAGRMRVEIAGSGDAFYSFTIATPR